ncbi:MAG: FkbM family methyltransferase [Alphaproteobacteria bacterium]|nr:FkbM family methyltransferase [Alphaproteobacteria bacterium]
MSDAPLHWQRLAGLLDAHGVTVVLDVGANTGQYAGYLRAAGWTGRIVSFEPQTAAHAQLTEAARADPAWTVAPPVALGAAEGAQVLHVSAESDMSSLREMRADFLSVSPTSRKVGEETVRVAPLDSLFDDHVGPADRAFLKIDTQGSEAEVLAGAGASLARIVGLQLELSLVPLYEGEADYRALLDRVHGLGFAPYLIIPGYWSRHLGRMVQFDGIFFRMEDETE